MSQKEAGQLLTSLEAAPMTLALLSSTGAGRVVNKVKKTCPALQARAKALITRWKELAPPHA